MNQKFFPAYGSRPWVMGILNVTPDSFSDGGRWADTDAAVRRGLALLEQGADLIDVGGESTRPGAHRVDPATEAARVLPVITALTEAGAICSVDTTRGSVAADAVAAGARIINDVSGGRADPEMFAVAAQTGAPLILMHWRGHSRQMDSLAHYDDVSADVRAELLEQVQLAVQAGVDSRSLILDPGLGFAKESAHSWTLLQQLDELVALGYPVLVGASRKRFLAQALSAASLTPRAPAEREIATAATSLISSQRGAWGVRVHEPRPSRDVFDVLAALSGQESTEQSAGSPLMLAAAPSASVDADSVDARPAVAAEDVFEPHLAAARTAKDSLDG